MRNVLTVAVLEEIFLEMKDDGADLAILLAIGQSNKEAIDDAI